jgi:prepilin-type N-terminal cleavage/methylation domain-containing protein
MALWLPKGMVVCHRSGDEVFARAFTMVELLASIAIIAVIAALVFAFVGNYVGLRAPDGGPAYRCAY